VLGDEHWTTASGKRASRKLMNQFIKSSSTLDYTPEVSHLKNGWLEDKVVPLKMVNFQWLS